MGRNRRKLKKCAGYRVDTVHELKNFFTVPTSFIGVNISYLEPICLLTYAVLWIRICNHFVDFVWLDPDPDSDPGEFFQMENLYNSWSSNPGYGSIMTKKCFIWIRIHIETNADPQTEHTFRLKKLPNNPDPHRKFPIWL